MKKEEAQKRYDICKQCDKLTQPLSLYSYIKNLPQYNEYKSKIIEDDEEQQEVVSYNFDVTQEYYDNRDEYKYVGIIDKDTSLKKSQEMKQVDLFKIREKRSKILGSIELEFRFLIKYKINLLVLLSNKRISKNLF